MAMGFGSNGRSIGSLPGRKFRRAPMSQINVTPFVDVMLVLLIVFMVTAPLLTVGVTVDLPKTAASRIVGQDEPLVVTINEEGKIFLQNTEVTIERLEEGIVKATEELTELESESSTDMRIQRRKDRIESFQEDVDHAKVLFDKIDVWYRPVSWGLAVLPKTGQTIGLLDRWLDDGTGFDIAALMRGDMQELEEVDEFDPTTYGARERETMRRLDEDYSERSLWYVVGTSLLFEGLILTLAAWYVCKKDF